MYIDYHALLPYYWFKLAYMLSIFHGFFLLIDLRNSNKVTLITSSSSPIAYILPNSIELSGLSRGAARRGKKTLAFLQNLWLCATCLFHMSLFETEFCRGGGAAVPYLDSQGRRA